METKDWLLKYSKRILLALFIFGIPYAALKMVMTEGLSISLLGKSILAVISDTGFGHLWYLYVLIGIYLIMPVLKRFCDNASVDEMTLVVITLFALSFFFPLISSLIGHKIAFASQMLYPVFYVLMGHLVFENKHRFNRRSLWLVTSGCVLLIWVFNAFDIAPGIWTRYDSPLIAILAISIFALFITQDWKDRKWLWGMDRICFGAYLIHPLFIQFTYRFLKITPIKFVCYPVMAVLFAIVFVALAFLAAWIMRKVGVLRKYVL